MSDVWHECANCGNHSLCASSADRDETIASLRAAVREYFAAIEHDAPVTVDYLHRCEVARAALRRLGEDDP